jgi:hypothetical protein
MKDKKQIIEGGAMQRGSALTAVCFTAGLIAALFSSGVFWLAVKSQLTTYAGVSLSPDFDLQWLYPRLVWGGLWGLIYYFTVGHRKSRRYWVRKGLWISLLPAAVQLLYVFPYQSGQDLLGLNLGVLTPVFIVVQYLVWGFFTGFFTRLLWGRE